VILYVGINDVHPRLFGELKLDYSNSRIAWRPDENALPEVDPRLARAYAYRYLTLVRLEQRAFFHIDRLVQKPYPAAAEWDAALARNGSGVYRRHLEDLVRLLRAQGKRVVVVPQVFLARGGGFAADAVFGRGVDEHNRVDEAVARELGVDFVGGVLTAGFGREDLLPADPCHFTPAGHERMAALLFDLFESRGITR